MATKTDEQIRMLRRHSIECVAQVQSRYGSTRTFQLTAINPGKRDRWSMGPLPHSGSNNADHTFVPGITKQADTSRLFCLNIKVLHLCHGVITHVGFDLTTFEVELIEAKRQFTGSFGRGQQALNTERHILQAACRIQTRGYRECEVAGRQRLRVDARNLQQCQDAGSHPAGTDAPNALSDKTSIVVIKRHHISDSAQCHQVEPVRQIGFLPGFKPASFTQLNPHQGQQVEGDADTSQSLAGKVAAGLVRIDNRSCSRQLIARQVMVSDDDFNTERVGPRHASNTGNSVIHRHNNVRLKSHGDINDFRRETVAKAKPIGYQVVYVRRTHRPQY